MSRVHPECRESWAHHGGGGARNALCHPHQRGARRSRRPRRGARLQAPGGRGARLPDAQEERARGASLPHYRQDRVRRHLFLCLLAAYVRWHLGRACSPLLFRDETPPARTDAVAPLGRSTGTRTKGRLHRTPDGPPVHGFAACSQTSAPSPATGWSWPGPASNRRSTSSPRPDPSRRASWPWREPRSSSQGETGRNAHPCSNTVRRR